MTAGDRPVRDLPADRRHTGDTRQVEFSAKPDQQRIDGAIKMLTELAAAADGVGAPRGQRLRVCLTLVRLPIGLPFNLFAFHLAGVDAYGEVIDEVSEEHEILYAFVVNQPVALMRETAVRFLHDLVARQAPIQQVMQNQRSVDELPRLIAATDASTAELAWDMPPEIAQALSMVGERAADAQLRLEVRFQLDPFPDQQDLAARVTALRALYDREERVRDAVDRTVSAICARHPSLRGGREDIRGFLRSQTALQGMRQFLNQTVRDAEVCGNGYLQSVPLPLWAGYGSVAALYGLAVWQPSAPCRGGAACSCQRVGAGARAAADGGGGCTGGRCPRGGAGGFAGSAAG